jgi:hypothetical protein
MPNNTSSSDVMLPSGVIASRPWIWVVLAFVVLLSAWTTLFYIAYHNQPESVPLARPVHAAS